MADFTLKKGPWTADFILNEGGYKCHLTHKVMGDMYLVEWDDAAPHMTKDAFDDAWELIDELRWETQKDAASAIRGWSGWVR